MIGGAPPQRRHWHPHHSNRTTESSGRRSLCSASACCLPYSASQPALPAGGLSRAALSCVLPHSQSLSPATVPGATVPQLCSSAELSGAPSCRSTDVFHTA